jgi:predicted site-specific integrase-resolvase
MPARKDAEHEQWLEGVVSLAEAAALRKISVATLRALIRQGRLHSVRLSLRKIGMTRREALRSARDWPSSTAK